MLTQIKNFGQYITFLLAFLLVFVSFNLPTQAQTLNRGLIVSPAINDLEVEKGQSYQVDIDLQNDTETKNYNLDVFKQSFASGSSKEGEAKIVPFDDSAIYQNWLKLPEQKISLQPGDKKTFAATLDIPESAAPGGYYYSIVFANQELGNTDDAQVKIKEEVAALIFVQVKGQINREVRFTSFSSDKKIYDPRTYLKKGEEGLAKRLQQACDDLRSTGKTIFGTV